MKLLRIGFVAAVAMAFAGHALAAAPKIDAAARAKGMKEAPAAVQLSGADCTVTDAQFLGQGAAKVNGKDTNIYEVACQQGMGYFAINVPTVKTDMIDCLALRAQADAAIAAKGKPGTVCTLPANADPKQGLAPYFTKIGIPCAVTGAREVGINQTDQTTIYETHCSTGHGYFLVAPRPGSTKPLRAVDCSAVTGLFATKCQLTPEADVTQQIIAGSAGAKQTACQPNAARWVMSSTAGDNYFEIGCADGKSGFIYASDAQGAIKTVVPCARAEQYGGGCTLTSVDVAKTAEASVYTQQAKMIGYPCTVSKYQSLGAETAATHREVVEMACREHPGSVWTFLPTGSGGDAVVVNCLRSAAYGLPACKLTPMSATYADLGQQIKAKGKTCDVTGARYINGVRTAQGDDFVEVACSGGGGGMVIAYTPAKIEAVRDVFSCKETAGTSRACTLK